MQPEDSAYCVPYALKSVLEFYGEKGKHVSLNALIKGCNAHFKNGTGYEDTEAYLKTIGYKFKRIKFSGNAVRKSLKKKIPVVVSYWSHTKDSHFSVITGVEEDKYGISYYTLTDSYFGRVKFPWSVFEILWRNDCSWARTIVPIK